MKTIDIILCRFSDALRALSGAAPSQEQERRSVDFVAALQAARAVLWPSGVACGATNGARFPHATPYPPSSPLSSPSVQPLPILSRPDNVSYSDSRSSHQPAGEPGRPVKIQRHRKAKIVLRPRGHAFRLQRIILWDRPGDWDLHDVQVGNRSQFQVPGRIRGELLSADYDVGLRADTCQAAMDLVLVVEYVGGLEEGAVFDALAVGSAA